MKNQDSKPAPLRGEYRLSEVHAHQIGWLEGIIKALIILNLLDAIFTLFWVKSGIVKEKNILLSDLINNHPMIFMTVKISLVSFGSILLWRFRKRVLAVIGIFVVFVAYYVLLLYHLKYSTLLIYLITS
jgi:hypothetical protein